MQKPTTFRREKESRACQYSATIQQRLPHLEHCWVTGPSLRKILNISSVTLWRWRHREGSGFPPAKNINGRLFFYWPDVQAWLDKQPIAA